MDKHRVLLNGRLLPGVEARLAADYDLHRLAHESDPRAFLAAHGGEFVALVTSAGFGADTALIDALPELRVISNFGVGVDRIDLGAAARRGIPVGYTPDVLNDCVADLAFGLMLDAARGISAGDRFVRRGAWPGGGFPLGRRVSGARLGIVGLGRIGRTIARRADGFEMDVRYHGRRMVNGVPWRHEPELAALARWADYLVVDEAALVRALAERRIAGAALDVFEREPHVPAELFALDNVVLVPHIASATRETREAMGQRVLDNLRAFFAGAPLPSAVPLP